MALLRLGAIRPTSANDAFDPALWETFVSTTLGLEVPTLAALPRLHNSPLAKCGCKKRAHMFIGTHCSSSLTTVRLGCDMGQSQILHHIVVISQCFSIRASLSKKSDDSRCFYV